MWRYGLKTLLPEIGDLLNNQTFNLFLIWFLGPAALASYNRPKGLVRNIQAFVRRYAFTLTPTASSLQAVSAEREIRELFIQSCQTGAYIVFPMVFVLVITGGPILQVWMGPEYADDILPAILALGYLPFLLQLPLNSLLQGFNSHGWPGLFKFIASITGIVAAFTALSLFHSSITSAAIALFLPFWISEFIATPVFATKKHQFSLRKYWITGILKPLLLMTPMILCLLIFRSIYAKYPVKMLLAGIPTGLLCFFISYWFFGASQAIKEKIKSRFQLSRYFKNLSN
jgi:O-antigen/teichoic acid export membrane protein